LLKTTWEALKSTKAVPPSDSHSVSQFGESASNAADFLNFRGFIKLVPKGRFWLPEKVLQIRALIFNKTAQVAENMSLYATYVQPNVTMCKPGGF
jgi:hypothetical protein